ncbi:MAG: hypothetical protein ACR2HX_06120 [Pyrinomonadaceae bacterium]
MYLFGEDEADSAQTMIAALRDNTSKAVKQTIAAHKTVWTQKSQEEQSKLSAEAVTWASRHSGHRVECPACTSTALVTGSPVRPAIKRMEGDLIIEKQDFLPAKFECVACDLKITGFSHLNASGLGDTFTATLTWKCRSSTWKMKMTTGNLITTISRMGSTNEHGGLKNRTNKKPAQV